MQKCSNTTSIGDYLSEWIKACTTEQLKPGQLFSTTCNEKKILLSNFEDNIRATDLICTHANADLSTGFLNKQGIRCPLHLSVFDLDSGKPQNLPAELPLNVYNVKINDGQIYVEI